jgi:hypothetical protein
MKTAIVVPETMKALQALAGIHERCAGTDARARPLARKPEQWMQRHR